MRNARLKKNPLLPCLMVMNLISFCLMVDVIFQLFFPELFSHVGKKIFLWFSSTSNPTKQMTLTDINP